MKRFIYARVSSLVIVYRKTLLTAGGEGIELCSRFRLAYGSRAFLGRHGASSPLNWDCK